MEIFLEILGVVFLAATYFLLQTYTSKKSRIPNKLNKPELVPIIENSQKQVDKVSFEDLVDEMTNEESENENKDFTNQFDDDELIDESFSSSGKQDYFRLEEEVIRLGKLVDKLAKKPHSQGKKNPASYKEIFQSPNSVREAFIISEILKPKFKS